MEEVYAQIYKDIDQAIALLSESDESRPNKSHIDLNVAQGLKARFALTTGDWVTAADMAHQARQGYALTGNYKSGWNDANDSEWTNDYIYMKSGEMYLIEAEALARQNKDMEAQNVIYELTKNRDPEAQMPTMTGEALIQHILMERRCDLWGDGFRLFDIKRLNIPMDRHNKGHNETFWNIAGFFEAGAKELLFLIPKQEIDANPLMEQNPL